jgi:hypothetical protein
MSISTGEGTSAVLVYVGPDAPIKEQMAEYLGTFRSDEADATVTIAVKGDRLVVRTRKFEEGQPPGDSGRGVFPLDPLATGAFKNQWVGLVRFTRDSKGQITGFVVNNFAGGVRHLRFSRIP